MFDPLLRACQLAFGGATLKVRPDLEFDSLSPWKTFTSRSTRISVLILEYKT